MMCIWLVEQLMFSGVVMNLCFEPFTSCNTHWMLNKKTSKCSFFCKQAPANSTFPLPLPPYRLQFFCRDQSKCGADSDSSGVLINSISLNSGGWAVREKVQRLKGRAERKREMLGGNKTLNSFVIFCNSRSRCQFFFSEDNKLMMTLHLLKTFSSVKFSYIQCISDQISQVDFSLV